MTDSERFEEITSDNEDQVMDEAALKAAMSQGMAAAPQAASVQSRAEKKSRQAIGKLGLEPCTNINRITMKTRGSTDMIVIPSPDVFKNSSNTYIVFGEAKSENPAAQQQMAAAQQLQQQMSGMNQPAAATNENYDDDEESDVDEAGMEAKDIELVMTQGQCSKAKAVKALIASKGDVVTALLELQDV